MSCASVMVVWCLSTAAAPVAAAEPTSLWDVFAIRLLPGFEHERIQGIDSLPGKLVHEDGRTISYDIGRYYPPGAARTGGAFDNRALQAAANEGTRLTVQTVGALTFYVAQSAQGLTISTVSGNLGINFSAKASSAEDVADVLLMVLSLTGAAEKPAAAEGAPASSPPPRNE